jgi:hypothetical protein
MIFLSVEPDLCDGQVSSRSAQQWRTWRLRPSLDPVKKASQNDLVSIS